jgi:hypothetical protein
VEEGWTYLTAQQQDDMPEETPTEQQEEGEKQTPLEDKETTETREEEEEAKHEVSNKKYFRIRKFLCLFDPLLFEQFRVPLSTSKKNS